MSSLKMYQKILSSTPGSNLEKIKQLLSHYAEEFRLEQEGLLIDLLDDQTLTAEDLLEVLTGMAEYELENKKFNNAVIAIRLLVEQRPVRTGSPSLEVAIEDDSSLDFELPNFNSGSLLPLAG